MIMIYMQPCVIRKKIKNLLKEVFTKYAVGELFINIISKYAVRCHMHGHQ